ncbi:uncharacterized protein C8Q71DRAFT_225004 [Rhodofomes roseus]|uniref:Uncharacterized protein n=1 Tax=Rhodofomes roseus TaxID=34475 RepID=A0ABQ8KUW4_9APHY|nr:uncharacterized protein C8Q71DRAFT_225004 [Rhodofomes roseus]KAH9842870.1 hypothetical protein C8Q71DRAFT_225004 [Rhodofomes roseus]
MRTTSTQVSSPSLALTTACALHRTAYCIPPPSTCSSDSNLGIPLPAARRSTHSSSPLAWSRQESSVMIPDSTSDKCGGTSGQDASAPRQIKNNAVQDVLVPRAAAQRRGESTDGARGPGVEPSGDTCSLPGADTIASTTPYGAASTATQALPYNYSG